MIPVISFDQVRLAYGTHIAVDEVTLALPAQSVVALIGPNGSGKSTLLGAMAGLIQPLSGHITVLGQRPGAQRSRLAYVLQQTPSNGLLPMTVTEVVLMGRYATAGMFRRLTSADRATASEAMERLDILPLATSQLRELSGGQRQRVLVAQGLAQQADILLLDEPITGLDLVSKELILTAMQDERDAGRTVLVTTHDLSDADRADQVVLLDGRVVAAGAPSAVLTPANLRDAYGAHLIDLGVGVVVDDAHDHDHPVSQPGGTTSVSSEKH
ncbi:MAG: metal ABC transporter ATP-binding protein [Euzebya sp.]